MDASEPAEGILRSGGRGSAGSIARRVVADGLLYQLEYRQCGKRPGSKGRPNGCRCMRSSDPQDWHGPYAYAYTTVRRRGGGAAAGGRWRRLPVFPREGYALLGVARPSR